MPSASWPRRPAPPRGRRAVPADGAAGGELAAEGGDPGQQLGTYIWGDGGSDGPWLPGAPSRGAGEPLTCDVPVVGAELVRSVPCPGRSGRSDASPRARARQVRRSTRPRPAPGPSRSAWSSPTAWRRALFLAAGGHVTGQRRRLEGARRRASIEARGRPVDRPRRRSRPARPRAASRRRPSGGSGGGRTTPNSRSSGRCNATDRHRGRHGACRCRHGT